MLKFISNIRNISASGSIQPNGFPQPQGFNSSDGVSNLIDDADWTAEGKAGVTGIQISASASASQTSKLSLTSISMSGKLEVDTMVGLQGNGTADALAASNFEVTFSLDVASNFTLTGDCGFASHTHTKERRDFSITANGTVVATLNDLHGTPKALALPAGTIAIILNTQVGAQTDPIGDMGRYTFSFSLVSA